MKKLTLFIFIITLGVANLRADEQMKGVQEQLKTQGFYYGQIDGQPGTETTAAIRRYQIRNGLQVTGTLTQETLDSLNAGGNPATPPAATDTVPAPQPQALDTQQPQQPEPNVNQSDRDFLKNQNQSVPPQQQPPPPPPPENNSNVLPPPVNVPSQASVLSEQYAVLYAHTPYETAPIVLQQGTLKNAQYILARRRYYSGAIDGIPGPGTARAVTLFQNDSGLAQTGRLDLDTLNALGLLPNSRRVMQPHPMQPPPVTEPFYPPQRPAPRVYRGIWVN